MAEGAGATLIDYYVDPAAATAYIIFEADEPSALDPILFHIHAGGQVDVAAGRIVRLLTSAEYAEVAKQAGEGGYRPPAA